MSSEKTATERLRHMLDERGVEYDTGETVDGETVATFWSDRDGHQCSAIEGADNIPGGEICMQAHTIPEQAIDVTLGCGTCHDAAGKQLAFFACSACGSTDERKRPRFCHGCGRVVVDE